MPSHNAQQSWCPGSQIFLHHPCLSCLARVRLEQPHPTTAAADLNNEPAGGAAASNASHGTHVMGTAAGGWGDGDTRGVAGIVGPARASLLSCNVFGMGEGSATSDIVKCLVHAVQRGAHWVVNLSLGVRRGLLLRHSGALAAAAAALVKCSLRMQAP